MPRKLLNEQLKKESWENNLELTVSGRSKGVEHRLCWIHGMLSYYQTRMSLSSILYIWRHQTSGKSSHLPIFSCQVT